MSTLWGPYLVSLTKCGYALEIDEGFAISDFILDVVVFVLPLPVVRLPFERDAMIEY